jgi:hypothetical protein
VLTRCHYWPGCIIIAYAVDLVLHAARADTSNWIPRCERRAWAAYIKPVRIVKESALSLSTRIDAGVLFSRGGVDLLGKRDEGSASGGNLCLREKDI